MRPPSTNLQGGNAHCRDFLSRWRHSVVRLVRLGATNAAERARRVGAASGWLTGALVMLMMLAILREVIGRYFFGAPSNWSLELCGYLLVALAYLGAPFTELEGGNIRVDFLYARIPQRLREGVDIFICMVAACWSGMLAWQGWLLALHSWRIGARSSQAMAWPLFPAQVMVPLGCLLVSGVFVLRVIDRLRRICARKEE